MKTLSYLAAMVIVGCILYPKAGFGQQTTPTGFYYPTGTSNLSSYAPFLAMGCNGATAYLTNQFHLGKDIAANTGASVYAIAGGTVTNISTNGWGTGNVALIIKHKLSNGIEFFAVYGHVVSNLIVGNQVTTGAVIATIGSYNPSHLHFGIYIEEIPPAAPLGIMDCAFWPDTNGFTEPTTWITTQEPSSLTVDHLDQQAQRDMVNRAAMDPRFGTAMPETFGKDLNWDPSWQLRWMNFNFTGSRVVTMYHATNKTDTSVRYTIFWDPDTGSWGAWTPVP